MKEIVPGIYTWSRFSAKHGYNFNGYAFKSDDGLVVIDPATMKSSDLEQLQQLGTPAHILLTNKDHERMAYELRDRFGAKIYIHEKDASLIKSSPDHTFQDGEILPGNLKTINIPDNKSPGETALLLSKREGVLFIGDALIGWPKGEVSFLPSIIYKDPKKAKEAIKILLDYDYGPILVGDGEPVLKGGKDAIKRFLAREGVFLTLPVQ